MYNTKYKFIEDIWISGILNGNQIIGRTTIYNNEEVIVFINDDAKIGYEKFTNILEPKRLLTSVETQQSKILETII